MVSVKTMNTKWMSNKKDIKAKFYSLGALVKICSLYHRFICTSCRYTSWLCVHFLGSLGPTGKFECCSIKLLTVALEGHSYGFM